MSIRSRLKVLLSLLFLVALANTVSIFLLESSSSKKMDWVIHTHQAIEQASLLLGGLQDAETGQRGYLLTADLHYLEPYYSGQKAVSNTYRTLSDHVSDNPGQVNRLSQTNQLITAKFNEMDQTIRLMKRRGPTDESAALMLVRSNQGKALMDEIRKSIADFIHQERLLLEIRNGEYRETRAYVLAAVVVEIVFLLTMAILTASFIKNKLFEPIEILLKGTEKMERGEAQTVRDLVGEDEMGRLLYRFYEMSQKVHTRTETLTYKATHDALTGLKNRLNLDADITEIILLSAESGRSAALFYLDINNFKPLNDDYGHDTGDLVLVEVARRIKGCIRSSDNAYRIGGDEFVVLLGGLNHAKDAHQVLASLRTVFANPVVVGSNSIMVTLSIGVATSPQDAISAEELLKLADLAMYDAKRSRSEFAFADKAALGNLSTISDYKA
ncbi:CHASE3 domain-containing protein [Vibrio sp.]|uniref:CHASE3 domain-containing protein n=1 Tax=Vibrio sp. TaxID=678 RepID=UPI003D0B0C4C